MWRFSRRQEPLLVKRAITSTEDASSSSTNSSGEDESGSDEEDTDGKDDNHNNKGDPPRKYLSTGFWTPIIEEPYTKF